MERELAEQDILLRTRLGSTSIGKSTPIAYTAPPSKIHFKSERRQPQHEWEKQGSLKRERCLQRENWVSLDPHCERRCEAEAGGGHEGCTEGKPNQTSGSSLSLTPPLLLRPRGPERLDPGEERRGEQAAVGRGAAVAVGVRSRFWIGTTTARA